MGAILRTGAAVAGIISDADVDFADSCPTLRDDSVRFWNWTQKFTNPITAIQTVVGNINKNFSAIEAAGLEMSGYYEMAWYKDAGEKLGDISVLALGPLPTAAETIL